MKLENPCTTNTWRNRIVWLVIGVARCRLCFAHVRLMTLEESVIRFQVSGLLKRCLALMGNHFATSVNLSVQETGFLFSPFQYRLCHLTILMDVSLLNFENKW